MTEARTRVTEIVSRLQSEAARHDAEAPELFSLLYDDLRAMASRYLASERRGHTLQPTAVVHESFLRLVDQTRIDWKGRGHFLAVAARVMRRVLVDHARRRGSQKRGGDWQRVTLVELGDETLTMEELLALEHALEKLAALDARQAQVVELRFFTGMSVEETATLLGVSRRTVEGDWTHARAWLGRELASRQEGPR